MRCHFSQSLYIVGYHFTLGDKVMSDGVPTVELDARGLNCPMPLLKLKQQLNQMEAGQLISVQTTDVGSVRDFSAFAEMAGHTIREQSEQNGVYLFIIEKRAES